MRPLALSAVALLVVAAGCSSSNAAAAPDAALQRDLQLASTSSLALAPSPTSDVMALETVPRTVETPAVRPRAAASGPRRVASRRPTAASTHVEQPAPAEDDSYAVSVVATAAEIGSSEEASGVALPRPVPVSVGLPSSGGDYDAPSGPSAGDVVGDVVGDVLGGVWGGGGGRGVVIRGGDIDDCKIHDDRNRARRPATRRPETAGGSIWGAVREQRPPQRTTTGSTARGGGGNIWDRARRQ